MPEDSKNENNIPRIVVMKNGSYHVFGNVPLVHKTQVVSEYGEPLTWRKDKDYPEKNIEGRTFYGLCRCGNSKNKPFCDGTHREISFDGTETADTQATETRCVRFTHGTHIIVKKDPTLCMQSGFCAFRDAGLYQLIGATSDTRMRSLVMAMVERCPSGALTYYIEPDDSDIEPDLPVQIAATTEITSSGPIQGPLWVSGKIPVERADGKPFETRNRMTLCCCGQSCKKPLCDGTHRGVEEKALKRKKSQEG